MSVASTPESLRPRSEAQILRSLVENGVAKRFDLRAWSDAGCKQATAAERLAVLLEQVRVRLGWTWIRAACSRRYQCRIHSLRFRG
jgi:hypothetical protein